MNYSLHQLQIFLKVSQLKSITKAADELHLTQPAVSIQLKNFKDQFEDALFEVIGHKLYITDFGWEIANAAQRILNEVQEINFKAQGSKGQISGRLKIAIVSTGKYIMPLFLHEFLKKNPNVELIMDVTNRAKVLESLENNESDFCLVSILPDNLQIQSVELMENNLFLVVSGKNTDVFEGMDTNIFDKIQLIYREAGSGTRRVMEQYLQKNNFRVTKKIELTSNEAVKQAVIADLGCSILPLIGIKNELLVKDLRIVPFSGLPVKSTWNLIWNKRKEFSPVANAFLSYLHHNKQSIIKEHFSWSEKYLNQI
jgi:LysR family transcriptional regulator, low CO2-responsive transcriptional regulator